MVLSFPNLEHESQGSVSEFYGEVGGEFLNTSSRLQNADFA